MLKGSAVLCDATPVHRLAASTSAGVHLRSKVIGFKVTRYTMRTLLPQLSCIRTVPMFLSVLSCRIGFALGPRVSMTAALAMAL